MRPSIALPISSNTNAKALLMVSVKEKLSNATERSNVPNIVAIHDTAPLRVSNIPPARVDHIPASPKFSKALENFSNEKIDLNQSNAYIAVSKIASTPSLNICENEKLSSNFEKFSKPNLLAIHETISFARSAIPPTRPISNPLIAPLTAPSTPPCL